MIRISQKVGEILTGDEVALEAMRAGILNLSAYASSIQPQIEESLYKNVRKGSIVTALSRLSQSSSSISPLKVPVRIEDMSIKSPLSEITYEKTIEVAKQIAALGAKFSEVGFFTSTQGIGEVTLIVSQSLKHKVLEQVKTKPKGEYDNLVAITVRFSEKDYIEVPNMIYTLVATLAGKRINLIEIVSTFTEISFIVRQKDMKETIDVLKNNFLA
ncbi:MAG: hypothetical protein ACD_12C00034G0009 [uncultured bacterium]|nr:MAG: hypothetical protein ACD_12C00034G0009 [uncultured bacterium]